MKEFREFLNNLNESFDLKYLSKVKRVVPSKIRELILDRYIEANIVNAQDIKEYSDILKKYHFLNGFVFTEKDEFLIIFMVVQGMKEVHLMNLSDGDGAKQTFSLGKSSQKAFATTLNQIVIFLKKYSGPLKIKFEPTRLGLYEKILNKVLQKHLQKFELQKSYTENINHIFIINKSRKYFNESIFTK